MRMTKPSLPRRRLLAGAAIALFAAALPASAEQPQKMTIYKSPACGCCQAWAEHVKAAGFATEVIERGGLTSLKDQHAIPQKLRSCHTALIEGYVIEGHVPASAIRKLLAERPQAAGLAASGMPIGSPGMEVEGSPPEIYDVVLFGKGVERSFARFRGGDEIR